MSEPVKLTFKEIYEANGAFHKLAMQSLPPKAAYRVAKLLKKITAEMNRIEDARMELFRKYGMPDGSKTFSVAPDKVEEFTKEQEVLLAKESDLVFEALPLDLLSQGNMTPADMIKLDRFITE